MSPRPLGSARRSAPRTCGSAREGGRRKAAGYCHARQWTCCSGGKPEPGLTMLRPSGTRAITTLRKLPTQSQG